MSSQQRYVSWLDDLGIDDVPEVGRNNASLGGLFQELKPLGVEAPNGFAVTASASRDDPTGRRRSKTSQKTCRNLWAIPLRLPGCGSTSGRLYRLQLVHRRNSRCSRLTPGRCRNPERNSRWRTTHQHPREADRLRSQLSAWEDEGAIQEFRRCLAWKGKKQAHVRGRCSGPCCCSGAVRAG